MSRDKIETAAEALWRADAELAGQSRREPWSSVAPEIQKRWRAMATRALGAGDRARAQLTTWTGFVLVRDGTGSVYTNKQNQMAVFYAISAAHKALPKIEKEQPSATWRVEPAVLVVGGVKP